MLINLSNHYSENWCERQIKTAIECFGSVKDIPFPNIYPEWDTEKVVELANQMFKNIISEKKESDMQFAVHLMGEFTFVFSLTTLLLKSGITCLASTTQRKVTQDKSGKKISEFHFVQFRKYSMP